jgi:hypothetical protein
MVRENAAPLQGQYKMAGAMVRVYVAFRVCGVGDSPSVTVTVTVKEVPSEPDQ